MEVMATQRALRTTPTHTQWTMDESAWRRQGAHQLSQVVQQLPGAQVRDYGGAGAQVLLSARGLGTSHTTMAVDGFPLTDMTSGSVDLGRWLLGDFSQIQWSIADGMSLLTSVRSLGASRLSLTAATTQPRLAVEWGSFGRVVADGVGTWRSGAHELSAMVSAARADNDFPFRLDNGNFSEWQHRGRSPWTRYQASGQWRWNTAHCTTQVRLLHQRHRQTLPGAVTLYTTHEGEDLATKITLLQAKHEALLGRFRWRWAAQWQAQQMDYADQGEEYPDGVHAETYQQHEVWNTLGASYALSPSWHVAYAADGAFTTLRSNMGRFDEVARTALQQSFSLRWVLPTTQMTLRALRHDFFHHVVVPKVGVAPLLPWESSAVASDAHRWTWSVSVSQRLWQWPTTQGTLRAGVQSLFRMPSFAENYYHRWGNANLRPERTQQCNLGIVVESGTAQRAASWQWSVDVYHNRVLDRILGVPVNQTVWRTTNLDRVRSVGADLAGVISLPLARRHTLSLNATASWQRVTDESEEKSATYGLQLPYIPAFTAHASAVWRNPWCDVSLSADYSSERHATANHYREARLAPYVLLHVAVGRDLSIARCKWRTQLAVNNFTNAQYALVRGYPMPGCSLTWRNVWTF